jgi:hypothetical protein
LKSLLLLLLLLLSFHLHLGSFWRKILHAFPISTTCSTCHFHLIFCDLVNLKYWIFSTWHNTHNYAERLIYFPLFSRFQRAQPSPRPFVTFYL